MNGARASRPVTIAAIDVGTNSIHMVVASVTPNGFTVLATDKEVVRLGEGSDGMDILTDEAIGRGIKTLQHMKRVAESYDAEMRVVATSAVREAENQGDFVSAAALLAGIDVEVLSGVEEAHLIYLGVSQALNLGRGTTLVIDVGGGSTEFCVARRGSLRFAQSVKVGAVRMTDAYLPAGEVTEAGVRRLRSKIRSVISPVMHDLKKFTFDQVVVSSGTAETVTRMALLRGGRDMAVSLNGHRFSGAELSSIVRSLVEHPLPAGRSAIPGLDAKRADIIVAGSMILEEIGKALGIDAYQYSDFALREGVLVETAQRRGILEAEPEDPARSSALRLAERCSVDIDHAVHVGDLARQLMRGLGRYYSFDDSLVKLAEIAGILARVGAAIAYSKYHLHSYYMIRNADLMGLTDDEVETVALAVRYHRKSGPKSSHDEFARLSTARQHDVELIAAVLRIASGLDRARDRSVEGLSVSSNGDRSIISLRVRPDSGDGLELNVYTAQNRTGMLREFLDSDIIVRT